MNDLVTTTSGNALAVKTTSSLVVRGLGQLEEALLFNRENESGRDKSVTSDMTINHRRLIVAKLLQKLTPQQMAQTKKLALLRQEQRRRQVASNPKA